MIDKLNQEKGITLLALAVMVIIIFILSGVAIYYSFDSIAQTRLTTMTAKMQLLQSRVNIIYEKILSKDNVYVGEDENIIIGISLDNIQDINIRNKANYALDKLGIDDKISYRFFDKNNLNILETENIDDNILINFITRDVVFIDGVEYRGETYYRIKEISEKIHNVEYENSNIVSPEFEVAVQYLGDFCRIKVNNIQYFGNVGTGTLSYKGHVASEWISVNNNEFEVRSPGIYDIRLIDSAGNQTVKQAYVYVYRDMILCLDANQNLRTGYRQDTTIWEDLTIYNNDIELYNFDDNEYSGWQGKTLLFDGLNDYAKTINDFSFSESKKMTVQFTDLNGEIYKNSNLGPLFETSINSNNNYGSFYINTDEYGTNDICLAMKYNTQLKCINHKYANNVLSSGESLTYSIVYSTEKEHDNYIGMYKNGTKIDNLQTSTDAGDNISNLTIETYPLYISSRAGTTAFMKANYANIRIYKIELTQEEISINYEIDKLRYNLP